MDNQVMFEIDPFETPPTEWKEFPFESIQVPYHPTVEYTLADGTKREQVPPYVNHLTSAINAKAREDMVAYKRGITNAIKSLKVECGRSYVDAYVHSFEIWGTTGKVGVSASIPAGFWVDTPHGPIFNEEQMNSKAIDSDGDESVQVKGDKDPDLCVPIKSPITSKPVILQKMDKCPEYFDHLFAKDIPAVEKVALREQLLKAHHKQRTGLLTTAHDYRDLHRSQHMTWEERLEFLYSDPERFLNIEVEDMKAARKDGKSVGSFPILNSRLGVRPWNALFITGGSRVSDLPERRLNWVVNMDPDVAMKKCHNLDIEFRSVRPPEKTAMALPHFDDLNLVDRLMAMGVLKVVEFPHIHSSLPNCIMLWLERDGEVVGLQDNRRDGNITFAAVMPPCVALQAPDGNGGLEPKVISPLDCLRMQLAKWQMGEDGEWDGLDTKIMYNGVQFGNWPRAHRRVDEDKNVIDPMSEFDRFPVKTAMLVKAISNAVGEYGWFVTMKSGEDASRDMWYQCCRRSVAVDYYWGRENAEEMVAGWEMADAILRKQIGMEYGLAIAGTGKSDVCRKYLLAKVPSRMPIWIDDGQVVHPRRSAKMLSQMINAIKLEKKMTVAIERGDTKSQCWITPSGIDKQKVQDIFMDQVSHVQSDDFTKEKIYSTLGGEKRKCWLRDPKQTCLIGKLVTKHGFKAVPKPISQCRTVDGIPIDLVVPINELVDKSLQDAFCKDAVETEAIIDGQKVHILLKEMSFYRTGVASENTPCRKARVTFRGLDQMVVWNAVRKIRDCPMKWPDLTYVKAIRLTLQKLIARVGMEGIS